MYVRWDVEQIPENIEQTFYVLVVALGSSTVTDVATHSIQFDVDNYGGMSVSIRTSNQPKFVTQWTGNPNDWSVTNIPIEAGDPYTMRTSLEGRFPWSVLADGFPTDVWIMHAQSHASASDQGWTSAVKDVINIQDGISPPDTSPPTINNVNVNPQIGPIETIFTISVDVFDRSGVDNVVAYIQRPDETNIATISLTDLSGDGTYTGQWDSSSESVGTYLIDLFARDSLSNSGEEDNVSTLTVTKISSSITSSVSPTILIQGEEVTVTGSLNPHLADKTITLTFTRPDSSTFTRTVITNSENYTDLYTPDMVGTWSVSANWEGYNSIVGAASVPISFTVLKRSSSITCSIFASVLPFGSSISVSGAITPPINDTTLTLTYIRPDSSTFTRTVTTNPGGYTDTYTPDVEGSWSVVASWNGDAIHDNSSSSLKSFTVKKFGCLIATATYGSELSPQVQFLRRFRDNTVLTTFAGSSFMNVFNEFYYSFSPSVASIIAENSILRDIMKGVLYPLIGILHLSSTIFSSLSFAVELGVILAGLVASALIGIVYVLPLALIFSFIKKIKISRKIILIMGLIWIGSIMTLFIAEVSNSPLIMMISTSIFVIVTISTSVLTSLRVLTKRII